MKYGQIVGWGMYVPERVLTNQDLEKIVDTSDEWIVSRSGIRERRIAGEGETTATMSLASAQKALALAGMQPDELDLIIVATSSPDQNLPPVSSIVQDRLGASRAGAFELAAGCTGFVYGLVVAQQFIATGAYRNVLVIGTELISRFINWEDRNTCVLFGDGSGAVILQACDEPTGMLSFVLGSDGSGDKAIFIRGGGSAMPFSQEVLDSKAHLIEMDGRAVFKFASRIIQQATTEVVSAAGLTLDDIDYIIPHQANLRIIQLACKQLDLPEEKVLVNLDRYGNTSTASIPIGLCEALDSGKIKPGDTLALVGFGAGLTWAAATLQFGVARQSRRVIPWDIRLPERVRRGVQKTAGVMLAVLTASFLPFFSRAKRNS